MVQFDRLPALDDPHGGPDENGNGGYARNPVKQCRHQRAYRECIDNVLCRVGETRLLGPFLF